MKIVSRAKRRGFSGSRSSLGKIPTHTPALARAQRITERASDLGFDWPALDPVWDKVEEELRELKSAVPTGDPTRIEEEAGDLFFSLVNLCRFLHVDAEETLTRAVDRFVKRFAYIEARVEAGGRTLAESSLEEMDALWEEAKRKEREEGL
ncbi:MAG: hypothetical protein HY695_09110 [Deltaproteobacteria bacterium]|nr:hypothetical protein [Deltaproteobacteria bacterium]